jgi:hypothetical protein
MFQEEGWRGTLAKGVVGALGVVEDQPVGQFAVEKRQVGKEGLRGRRRRTLGSCD